MDIPAPKKEPEESKIAVKTVTTNTAKKEDDSSLVTPPEVPAKDPTVTDTTVSAPDEKTIPNKDDEIAKAEERTQVVSKLIEDKTYFLPIKEKRPPSNFIFFSAPKHAKKPKKVTPKKQEEKKSGHQTLLVIVLVVVMVGAVFAIDAGMVDIGLKLPFDLIKNS